MKLYSSIGPNPAFVNLFARLKDIKLEQVEVDILSGENREPAFLAKNPCGATPVLETAQGQLISETTAICEYLEELNPQPALIGEDALSRAITRMWWRRVDLLVVQPMTAGFRAAEGLAMFASRVPCFPESAQALKDSTQQGLRFLDQHMQGPYLTGQSLSAADLLLYAFCQFGAQVGQPIAADCRNLQQWFEHLNTQLN